MTNRPNDDIGELDAVTLARYYESGELSPEEATRAALDRIDRFNPVVNAYTYVGEQGAMEAARLSAKRWSAGGQLGPLDGIPASLKDLTEVRGMPAREGSLTTSPDPCQEDAPPAVRLRERGAVLLGKTNTPEFGWKAVTDNRIYGTTRNPWDRRLTPGGSSGGAAAAAALNMGVLHQGGDSGGSIRIPAAFTGVFGFMPTFGWVPQWPPAKMPSLSHIGSLTRSAEDAARMLNAMGRYDYRDSYAIRGQPEDWGGDLDRGVNGLRVAFAPDLDFGKVDDDVAARVDEAARVFEKLGADVETIDTLFDDPLEMFRVLWFTASQALCIDMSDEQVEQMDPGLVDSARRARDYHAVDLFRAQQARASLTKRMEHFFQDYDLLLTPAVPIPAFEAGHNVPPDSSMQDWMEWTPYSYPFNLTQQPAASTPCGFTDAGLPVGFQLVAGKFSDTRVLRACHAYMQEVPPSFPDAPR